MRDVAQRIQAFLRAEQPAMKVLLHALVEAESPSAVPAAQARVQALLADALAGAGYEVLCVPGRAVGGMLYARPRRRERGRPVQLLVGHGDTVWPVGTLQEMPFVFEDGVARGPGVFDMKGGLVQMVFALRALHALGLTPAVTPVVVVNSDEEVGSRESTPLIRRLARVADRAYVLEPSLGPRGKLKTSRKGGGRYTIVVHGRPAHAGLDPTAGVSAIVELAGLVQRLHALNDPEAGISVNVGMIEGGVQPNVVAPESRAVLDVRVPTLEAARRVEAAILGLTPTQPGITLSVDGSIGRPPMEPTPRNRQLWRQAREAGAALGLQLEEAAAGGASDGNTTSQWTATLDGLGAVGGGAHARHEHLVVDKMVERCALLVLLLLLPPLREPVAESHRR